MNVVVFMKFLIRSILDTYVHVLLILMGHNMTGSVHQKYTSPTVVPHKSTSVSKALGPRTCEFAPLCFSYSAIQRVLKLLLGL